MESPHISPLVLPFFRRIVRGYFRRHFRAVRLAGAGHLTGLDRPAQPLLVYANHGSWWDPMVSVLLAEACLPRRRHFAPMDDAALARYGILKHVGVFGVEPGSARGAAAFLKQGTALLAGNAALWVTPQGRFADARERPLDFKPGLARLAVRAGAACTVVPLAIEYVFWDERLPEVLLEFGTPIVVGDRTAEALETELADALEATMNSLAHKAIARNAAAFTVLREGTRGTGGFYAFGQRLMSRLRGRSYRPDHTQNIEANPQPGKAAEC